MDIPGGRIKWGDTVEETLKRELKEEVGLERFENRGLFHAAISNIDSAVEDGGLALFIYECVPDEGFEVRLSDEDIKYNWFGNKEAAEKLRVNYPDDLIQKLIRN